MEYKKIGETFFSGIGGCSSAELQVFIPGSRASDRTPGMGGSFETEKIEGMMVNMVWQEDTLNRQRYSIPPR